MAQMSALISFNPNTTILSADTNSNNTTIRSTYNAHDTATTAVHGMGASTIVGTALTQTLTNKTLASPIITGDLTLGTTSKLILGASGTYWIGNTNNPQLFVNSTNVFDATSTRVAFSTDISVPASSKVRFDGGSGDSFISEDGLDAVNLTAGNSVVWTAARTASNSSFTVNAGATPSTVLLIDGTGAGSGTAGIKVLAGIQPQTNGAFDIGATSLKFNSIFANSILLADIDPPTANYANRNGIIKGWTMLRWDGAAWNNDASYNVSGITSTSSSVVSVTWNTDFASSIHPVLVTTENVALIAAITARATGSNQISLSAPAGVGSYLHVMAIGGQ